MRISEGFCCRTDVPVNHIMVSPHVRQLLKGATDSLARVPIRAAPVAEGDEVTDEYPNQLSADTTAEPAHYTSMTQIQPSKRERQ